MTHTLRCGWLATGFVCLAAVAARALAAEQPRERERIKAFCIDFNWRGGKFAEPATFAHARAGEHVKWYRELGVNTIQTFCVSCDGYAWFRGSVAPVQPGMQGDFLKEITELGHVEGMKVTGYFCVAANTHWGKTHPELSHGAPGNCPHIPLSTPYLDYLCATIKDVLARTGIDGFMIDWVWAVTPKWIDCEKKMYEELFGEPFPGADKVDGKKVAEFQRRAVDRCWRRIHDAAKAAAKQHGAPQRELAPDAVGKSGSGG